MKRDRRWVSTLGVAAVLALSLMACGRQDTTEANVAEAGNSVVIPLKVYSGRKEPPPETTGVRVGTEVILRVQGLGPARARVFGPDGADAPTRDAPYQEGGNVVGTEQRFVVGSVGRWRVEHAETPGLVLAYVEAR